MDRIFDSKASAADIYNRLKPNVKEPADVTRSLQAIERVKGAPTISLALENEKEESYE